MARVYVTLKIMPDSPEADLEAIEKAARQKVEDFGGSVGNVSQQPIAFGLKAVEMVVSVPEEGGDTEDLERSIEETDEVQSVQVTDVRRAIG